MPLNFRFGGFRRGYSRTADVTLDFILGLKERKSLQFHDEINAVPRPTMIANPCSPPVFVIKAEACVSRAQRTRPLLPAQESRINPKQRQKLFPAALGAIC
jgi:hypothetical protein